jgi:predicted GNAT family N-acyltransferase
MSDVIRELACPEIDKLYLPLRKSVLGDELRFSPQDASVEWFRDTFDSRSIHIGFFAEGSFAGALRITITSTVEALPSGPYIPAAYLGHSPVAEISRVALVKEFRHRSIYPKLLQTSINRVDAEGVIGLFGIVANTRTKRDFYSRYGFDQIGEQFQYADGRISPTVPSILILRQKPSVPGRF